MLPTTKTQPKTKLSDYTTLIYGPTKIGKTTLCSRFPNALFLATEPGLNALEAFQWQRDENTPPGIHNWEDVLLAGRELLAGNHPFENVCVDTIDLAYRFCEDHVCSKENIAHASDMDYGKGFALVNNEFQRVLTKLAALPYGLILVSHAKEIEVKTQTGKYNKIVPTLPDKAAKIVLGMADMVLYCTTEEAEQDGKTVTRRVMKTKPQPYYDAGDRTGRLPETLPLSYAEFLKAFEASAKKKAA